MRLFKISSFLFLSLLSASGCMSMNDQVNPDMKTWTNHYMSAEPFIFDFKFPVHESKEMAKKDIDLSGMCVLEMDWLKESKTFKLVVEGYFERDSDGTPSFDPGIFLSKYKNKYDSTPSPDLLIEENKNDKGMQLTYPNTSSEILNINKREWIHFVFKGDDNLVYGETFCIPLDKNFYLSIRTSFSPARKPGSKWLLERQEILRKVVDNFKIEHKSEEKKKEEQIPAIDKK